MPDNRSIVGCKRIASRKPGSGERIDDGQLTGLCWRKSPKQS
jgi:hypothetical protein